MTKCESESLLKGYRALDLTDERGMICGRILGDLGVDVIKVEKPGGDPARRIAPFYHDIPHCEKSLFWFACNVNKRGVTLNIENRDGQEIFKKLAQHADFVIESFSPGYLDRLGLDYQELSKINKGLIMSSITPFGQTGPFKDFIASDILGWAMGGAMYVTGDPDRPPLQISFPQAYVNACAQAVAGTMIAFYYRGVSGEGQHIDVSIQESVAWVLSDALAVWDLLKRNVKRGGSVRIKPPLNAARRNIWACKDGFVNFALTTGDAGTKSSRALVAWMDAESDATNVLKETNWEIDWASMPPEFLNDLQTPIGEFFKKHRVQELYSEALKRGILLMPVCTTQDLLDSCQLSNRNFWKEVKHTELGTSLTYPGAFAKLSKAPIEVKRRAPLIGEHNIEIYEGELGISRHEMLTLFQAGII